MKLNQHDLDVFSCILCINPITTKELLSHYFPLVPDNILHECLNKLLIYKLIQYVNYDVGWKPTLKGLWKNYREFEDGI